MSRATYVLRDGKLVEKQYAAPLNAGPYVISDGMDPIRSMADGKMYDSKSAYRAGLKANGCVEVGNDRQTRSAPDTAPGLKRDIAQALKQHGVIS